MKKILRRLLNIFLTLILIMLITLGIIVACAAIYIDKNVDTEIDTVLELMNVTKQPSRLYTVDEDGNYSEYKSQQLSSYQNSESAEYSEIPQNLINAFIAVEDKRFREHDGVDWITTVKAVVKYIIPSKSSPGGSTITQQLIKNLSGDDDYSVKRKIQEIIRALKLEKQVGKEEILTSYLNEIYLSESTYGVKAAAKLYFSKELSELTLTECAAIAAITQAPTKWNPIINPENNTLRRKIVLEEMLAQEYITKEQFDLSYDEELVLNVDYSGINNSANSWYTDAVIEECIGLLSEKYEISYNHAAQRLYNGGYSIIIAMDRDVQDIIERHYSESQLFKDGELQSSFIVINPDNGNILGLIGGTNPKSANRLLNRATQTLRSPGSSIKPLSVYALALELGIINYASVYDDTPYDFGTQTVSADGTKTYTKKNGWPQNVSKTYSGLCCIENAVKRSINTVAVKILADIGIEQAYDFLSDSLKISSLCESGNVNDKMLSALALGGMAHGVTLQEITTAYSIFPQNGVYTSSRCVLKIIDNNGNTIINNEPEKEVVISEETAQTMNVLLSGVVNSIGGTAYNSLTSLKKVVDVAGKTGTTDKNNDRWFIGYTPNIVAGIWLGYDKPSSLAGVTSGSHIALWDSIMTDVNKLMCEKESYKKEFDDNLLIKASYCVSSGKLLTDACLADPRSGQAAVGYFTSENLPTERCDCHELIKYCTHGQGIACEACPDEDCIYVGLINTERAFPLEIFIKDAQYVCITLPLNYRTFVHRNAPYFINYIEDGVYTGISDTEQQYNRACNFHIVLTE